MRQMPHIQTRLGQDYPKNGVQRRNKSNESHTKISPRQKIPVKTLNHQLSELAYFSQQSQSTEMSQGTGSIERNSQQNVNSAIYAQMGTKKYLLSPPNKSSKNYLLSPPNRGSSRLFKNVVMCPPIVPKTLFSPVMTCEMSAKDFRESTSCNSSARKKKRQESNNSSLTKVAQAL